MNLNKIAVLCTFTILGIAGCASDPGKKVNTAEGELTADEQKAHAAEVSPATVGYDQVRRFLNVSNAEYQSGVNNASDPINIFHDTLAKTWNDHSVALNMYRDQAPLFFAMTYEGTDVVNHLFAPYHPPYREDVSQDAYRKYWPAVTRSTSNS